MPKNISYIQDDKRVKSLRVLWVKMGKVRKGIKCTVQGCKETAIRSISADKLGMLNVQSSQSRRSYLCELHYKEYKRQTKKERMIEKWKFNK